MRVRVHIRAGVGLVCVRTTPPLTVSLCLSCRVVKALLFSSIISPGPGDRWPGFKEAASSRGGGKQTLPGEAVELEARTAWYTCQAPSRWLIIFGLSLFPSILWGPGASGCRLTSGTTVHWHSTGRGPRVPFEPVPQESAATVQISCVGHL